MTPKEKAKELIDKFEEYSSDSGIQIGDELYDAKQCALIACDEIHEALKQTFHQVHKKTEMTPDLYLSESIAVHYYHDVKLEIEKL
jgi:NTP pyrophosphatase (non-canonical NTP hydrolase)